MGKKAGKEIVQLYLSDVQSTLPRPMKELKGFVKLSLEPGETQEATFSITAEELSFYDERTGCWTAEPGKFVIHIGASSADIRHTASFRLKE